MDNSIENLKDIIAGYQKTCDEILLVSSLDPCIEDLVKLMLGLDDTYIGNSLSSSDRELIKTKIKHTFSQIKKM